MAKDLRTKPKGWLKGVLNNYNDSETEDFQQKDTSVNLDKNEIHNESEQPPVEHSDSSLENQSQPQTKLQFSKENQDKVTIDIISAVENLLNDRQIAQFKNQDLKEQLDSAHQVINRLKNDKLQKEQIIIEKTTEVESLEDKLTSKQMNYDQLLEDFKEYQNTSNDGIENLKYQLEKETGKYNKLNNEFSTYQYENMEKTKQLEEKIRGLEVENQKLSENYQSIKEEKNQLLQTFNDFSERMSFSFSNKEKPKSNDSDNVSE